MVHNSAPPLATGAVLARNKGFLKRHLTDCILRQTKTKVGEIRSASTLRKKTDPPCKVF